MTQAKVKMNRDGTPKQSMLRILKNNFGIVAKVARLGPDYLISNIIMGVLKGLNDSVNTIFLLKLFNALDADAEFADVAKLIGLMALWYLFYVAIYWIHFYVYKPWSKQRLDLKMQKDLFLKAYSMDVACYDDPEFYNDFVWAMDEASKRSDEVIDDIGMLINRLVGFSTLITVIFTIDIPVALVLLFVSVVNVVMNQIGNRLDYEAEKQW